MSVEAWPHVCSTLRSLKGSAQRCEQGLSSCGMQGSMMRRAPTLTCVLNRDPLEDNHGFPMHFVARSCSARALVRRIRLASGDNYHTCYRVLLSGSLLGNNDL